MKRTQSHPAALARGSSVIGGTLAWIVIPPPGFDLIENSQPTNRGLSRMLMSPKPRRLMASCWSKPTPGSFTVSWISCGVPLSSTLKSRLPLSFTAFGRDSCRTRNKQSEIFLGRLHCASIGIQALLQVFGILPPLPAPT